MVELCERFTYYGCQGLFQNYIQRKYDGSDGGPGALGMGQKGATGLSTFFQFFCYITPILGAIVADQYLGRYKAIVLFCCVYIVGLLILFLTSLPVALEHGAGLGGFITALIIIGVGTGGIKSNVAPLIADQYTRKKMAVQTLKTGERVILDPAITYQRIYMIFYTCINVGALSLLATPYMEKYIGFWSAFLLALCMFFVGFAVLILGRKFYVVRPPQGSIITDAFKACWMMLKARNMNAAKPSVLAASGNGRAVPWNDHFIEELKRALVAMRVFIFFPVFWVIYNQFSNNFVSQAGQMAGHGIPNDLMQNFDPIAIIVVVPILDRFVYPAMLKAHIQFRPISRITVGFFVAALAMVYAAVLQHFIYQTGPCFGAPLACDGDLDSDGVHRGNNIHIAIQTPAYVLIGLSEIFLNVSGLEYAYTKAPPSMKSFVQSMYLLTSAFGSALSEALTPAAFDPAIMWMYTGLAVASTIVGCVFFALFRHLNDQEDEMNALEAREEEEDAMNAHTLANNHETKV
jgi:POT family proton-dependent oligopeptide transporter